MLSVVIAFPQQFGYFPDIYEYCALLCQNGYIVTYIGINERKENVTIDSENFKALNLDVKAVSYARLASKVILAINPDLVHVFHFRGSALLRLFSLRSRSKWIIDVRTVHVGNSNGNMKGLYFKNKFTHLETLVYNNIIVLTDKLKELLSPNIRSIETIPLGSSESKVDPLTRIKIRKTIRDELKLNESDIVFIYAGNMSPSRKIETFIDYFVKASADNLSVKLILLGADSNSYVDHLKTLGGKNVLFLDRVDYTKVYNYYYASDIGISYLPPNTPYDFQPATKILEYMQSRLLVFCNATLSHDQMVNQNNCGVTFANNYENFKIKYQFLLKSIRQKGHHEMIDNAFDYVQQYSWSNIVCSHLIPLYKKIGV